MNFLHSKALRTKQCVPCEEGVPRVGGPQVAAKRIS